MTDVILVVEDNAANARLVSTLLQARGWQSVHAIDADAALQWLQHNTPALILLDIQLPGRDGISLCKEIRSEQRYQNIPLIALTAHAMRGDEERLMAAGFDAYLSKPYRYTELYKVIENACTEHGSTPGRVNRAEDIDR